MVRHLLLDLDNTLYSADNLMNDRVTARMMKFVSDFLGISPEEARAVRFGAKHEFGTTLEWLQSEYGFSDPDAFFEAVHPESELAELKADPNLRPLLVSLGLPMTVLTNAPRIHAERVLDFFNIRDLFLNVFDVEKNNFRCKPHREAYTNALSASGFGAEETLFLDDYPKYLLGFQNLGGKTVLVGKKSPPFPPGLECRHISTIYELPRLLQEGL